MVEAAVFVAVGSVIYSMTPLGACHVEASHDSMLTRFGKVEKSYLTRFGTKLQKVPLLESNTGLLHGVWTPSSWPSSPTNHLPNFFGL